MANIALRAFSVITIALLLLGQLAIAWPPAHQSYSEAIGGVHIKIYKFYERSLQEYLVGTCTLGYAAELNGVSGIVTAGHCFDGITGNYDPPEIWWWTVYQPDRTGLYVGSPSHVYGDLSYIDTAFIPSSHVSPSILTKDPYGNAAVLPVESIVPWSSISVGMAVTKTGSNSGVENGHVQGYYMNLYGLKWVVRYINMSAVPGDSGGPVYQRTLVREEGYWTYQISLIAIMVAVDGTYVYSISVDGIQTEVGIVPQTWW